jgi:iron complex outermembrane receptor protein
VRAPSRIDRDVRFPAAPPYLVVGGPSFMAEVAHVVEGGVRAESSYRVSYSITLFRHDWDTLRSGTAVPVALENRIEGALSGVEGWAIFDASHPEYGAVATRSELERSAYIEATFHFGE